MRESNEKRDKGLLVIGALLWILLVEFIPHIYSLALKVLGFLADLDFWTNSFTDWLQAIWGMGSLIVAWLVGWITRIYNRNTEIQNRLAFEQFKPELKLSPERAGIKIENTWNFEASKLTIYCKGVAMRNGRLSESTAKDGSRTETFLFSQGGELSISAQKLCPDKDYFSCVVLYANYVSGIAYYRAINYTMWRDIPWNIGEESESIEGKLPSPLNQTEFEPFIKKASLKEQIEWRTSYSNLEGLLDEMFWITKPVP